MDFARFHKIAPEATPADLEIVTNPSPNYGSSPWVVRYQGQTITGADLQYCLRWVAAFRRWVDRGMTGKSYY